MQESKGLGPRTLLLLEWIWALFLLRVGSTTKVASKLKPWTPSLPRVKGGNIAPYRPPTCRKSVKFYPAKFDEEIRCELLHLPLDEAKFTPYIALSYTWGPPAVTTPILLEGKPFPVTRNLEGFLRYARSIGLAIAERLPPVFRLPEHASVTARNSIMQEILVFRFVEAHISEFDVDRKLRDMAEPEVLLALYKTSAAPESCYMTFWIDAICINQQDPKEKSIQVSRMNDIYGRALWTWVWLGEAGGKANFALTLSRDMRKQLQLLVENETEEQEAFDRIRSEESFWPRIDAVSCLEVVLTRDWFLRVWVVQEVAIAKSKIIVLLGFCPIPWDFLTGILTPCCQMMAEASKRYVLETIFEGSSSNEIVLHNLALDYAEIVAKKKDLSGGAGDAVNVPERLLFLLAQICGSFNATDPRDTIYAILGLLGTDTIPQELFPDYTTSVEDVFHNKDLAGVPSWVPDWRYVNIRKEGRSERPSAANVTDDGLELKLEGTVLGTVATVVHPTAVRDYITEAFSLSEDTLRISLYLFLSFQELKRLVLEEARTAVPDLVLDNFQAK
ncbi:hypothetical protein GP486_002946 [Trichoglossum hirsutum]|uniref:Heterokaryon incompatibility domain-containing protein n=1 Tax=Trichoglossum hirsutum TaxID=265104 RepID=A0A9P8LDF9_9PEZI|nr:hypothetical protein GP486_002946 [Trichoglossum hirsutum]